MKLLLAVGLAVANRWLPFELYQYWHWQGEPVPFLGDPEPFLSFEGAKRVRHGLATRLPGRPAFLFLIGHVSPEYKDAAGRTLIEPFAQDLLNLLVPGLARQEAAVLIVFVIAEQSCTFYRGARAKRLVSDEVVERAVAAAREGLARRDFDAAFERLVEALPAAPERSIEAVFAAVGGVCVLLALALCLKARRRRPEDVYHRAEQPGPWQARPTPFSAPGFGAPPDAADAAAPREWGTRATPFSATITVPDVQATPFSAAPPPAQPPATPFSAAS